MKKKVNVHITKLREEINRIDLAILQKINHRISLAQAIGEIKKNEKLKVYDPYREKKIYQKLIAYNRKISNGLKGEGIENIFSEIISYCRNLEEEDQNQKIGYLGPQGSFTHSAAIKQFGLSTNLISFNRINDVFWALSIDKIKLGVVPFENSIEGIVNNTLDLLAKNNFFIYFQFYLKINLNLLSREKKIEDIAVLYSHPQPFAQAREWIEKQFRNVILRETNSTSEAAEITRKVKKSACIGSMTLLKLFPQLNLLEKNIEDISNNMTRFLVISKQPQNVDLTTRCFTSMVVFIKDKKGALYEILFILAKHGINLNNLISRPSLKKNFDYYFFIEFIGNEKSEKIKQALNKIKKKVLELKVLGTYGQGNK